MGIKTVLACAVGKSSQWFLKTFLKGGSSLPGKLALKIDKDILASLSKGYEVVVVTGTNGKTVTTALLTKIFGFGFDYVLTNPSGSNMVQGIVSTFLSAKAPKNKNVKKIAVLEIDEASLSGITKYIKPSLFLFTNIFRDQMDRFGEIYTTYKFITNGAANAPNAPILCNGDAPIFNSTYTQNRRIYYGFEHESGGDLLAHYNTDGIICPVCQSILHYEMITYANLGKYFCPACNFKRPELTYKLTSVDSLTHNSSTFTVDGTSYKIEIGGLYNVYNALSAIAAAEYYDIPADKIQQALSGDKAIFGRQEIINIDGKTCTIVLVKNPVGLNQVIDMVALAPRPFSLVCLLNSDYADGQDVSWIWDGNYETFADMAIPHVLAGGVRHSDMALRLKVAGIDEGKIEEIPTLTEIIERIKSLPSGSVYILSTYTAMLALRKELAARGYIEGGM